MLAHILGVKVIADIAQKRDTLISFVDFRCLAVEPPSPCEKELLFPDTRQSASRHRARPHTADANDAPKLFTRHQRVGSDQLPSSCSREHSFADSETEGSAQLLTEPREEEGFGEQIGASLHSLRNFPATDEPAAVAVESQKFAKSKKQRSLEERCASTTTSLDLTSGSENDFLFTSLDTSNNKERYELGKCALDTVKHIMNVAAGSPSLSLSGSLNSVQSSVYSSKHNYNASSVSHTPLSGSRRMIPQSFDTKGAHTPTNGRQLHHISSVPTSLCKSQTLPRNYSTPIWSTTATVGSEEDDQILFPPTVSATSSSTTATGGEPNGKDIHHSPNHGAMEQKESSKGTLTEEIDSDMKTRKEQESEALLPEEASLQGAVSSHTGIFIEL